jgi:hypothetical protein
MDAWAFAGWRPATVMASAAIAFAIGAAGASIVRAGGELEQSCNRARSALGNCACIAGFLENHLGPERSATLMEAWVFDASGRPDGYAARELHPKYALKTLELATEQFLSVRHGLSLSCKPLGWIFTEE